VCGICGIVATGTPSGSVPDLKRAVERMCAALKHRGPDDEGLEILKSGGEGEPLAVLGHRRLSIIDLEGGHQPMCNEDGSVWTVYNGEIYNFGDLRRHLMGSGHAFQTRCDTECLVHLFEERGRELVDELRGMFAFAVWDAGRRNLTLARDRLGQKPLFYWHDDARGIFAFASELKALLEVPGFRRSVNPQALSDYLTFQYVPHPQCIFRSARKLPPGHVLRFEPTSERIVLNRYWRPEFRADQRTSPRQFREELRAELTDAIRLRMISDVPLGAFLSGGVDSSITVALMSELMDRPVRTFSIGFETPRFDESEEAALVARHCGTHHTSETLRPRALEVLPELVWHYDEPFADSSAIPTYYVSRLARRHVKVVLTGDAGDECFAGYPRYAAVRLGQLFDRLPGAIRHVADPRLWQRLPTSIEAKTPLRRLRRLMLALRHSPQRRYLNWASIFGTDRKTRLLTCGMRDAVDFASPEKFLGRYYGEVPDEDIVQRTTYVDLMSYLPCDLLTKVDMASMAHGLEARSPFLDHRVVELAGRIPVRQKLRFTMRGLEGKRILKETFKSMLPRPIIERRKMGFGVPIGEWFRGELRGLVGDMLLSRRSCERGYFEPAAVRRLVEDHVEGRADHGYRLWALLMLELWHRRFVDEGEVGL
jgi:asparagine synthase (glutamine-hydrolysing)